MFFGERIRELRESQGLLQRQLAANLEIDTPMFSKIERGERKAKREQVLINCRNPQSKRTGIIGFVVSRPNQGNSNR